VREKNDRIRWRFGHQKCIAPRFLKTLGSRRQLLYTTLIFGPVTAVLALKTRTIWPGAILHYLNNLPAAVG
jgi:hypothetical protein